MWRNYNGKNVGRNNGIARGTLDYAGKFRKYCLQ